MDNRKELCSYLRSQLEQLHSKEVRQHLKNIMSKHKIDSAEIFNYITLREDPEVASTEYLYCILEEIDNNAINKFFSPDDIARYKNYKFSTKEKFALPYSIKMQQVSPDQWIAAIQVSELNKLGDANMLRYNENTQRPMQFVHNGKVEYYRPYTNRNALKRIRESFEEERYIPNTITLNMPEGTVYEYDEDMQELKIKVIDHFDILDGYHRYRVISDLHNEDYNWDYPMELRIVAFQESKAKRFIYQEDQKTKMSKIASNAMNTAADSNKIVAQLNADETFELNGLINMNDGIIKSGELAAIVAKLWYNKSYTNATETAKMNITVKKQLKKGFSSIIEADESKLTTKWDRQFLFAAVLCIKQGVSNKEILDKTNIMAEKFREEKVFTGSYITSPDMRKVNAIAKEVINYDVQ